MEKIEKIFVWDADECLISMIPAFIIYLNQEYGLKLKYEDFTDFSYEKVTRIPEEEMMKIERKFYETTLYDEIKPKEGAVEVVEHLSNDFCMPVVTGRSKCDEKHLIRTLDKLFRPHHFEEILHLGKNDSRGLIMPKWVKCKEIGARLIVDDNTSTVIHAAEKGIHAILMEAPCNRNVIDLPKEVYKAKTPYQVLDIIYEKEKIIWPT